MLVGRQSVAVAGRQPVAVADIQPVAVAGMLPVAAAGRQLVAVAGRKLMAAVGIVVGTVEATAVAGTVAWAFVVVGSWWAAAVEDIAAAGG